MYILKLKDSLYAGVGFASEEVNKRRCHPTSCYADMNLECLHRMKHDKAMTPSPIYPSEIRSTDLEPHLLLALLLRSRKKDGGYGSDFA